MRRRRGVLYGVLAGGRGWGRGWAAVVGGWRGCGWGGVRARGGTVRARAGGAVGGGVEGLGASGAGTGWGGGFRVAELLGLLLAEGALAFAGGALAGVLGGFGVCPAADAVGEEAEVEIDGADAEVGVYVAGGVGEAEDWGKEERHG